MVFLELIYNQSQACLPLACLAAAEQCKRLGYEIKLKHNIQAEPLLIGQKCHLQGDLMIARYLHQLSGTCPDPLVSTHVEFFLQLEEKVRSKQHLPSVCYELNAHLASRTFLCGDHDTIADYAIWKTINNNPRWLVIQKTSASVIPHLLRWFVFISQVPNMSRLVQAEKSFLKRRRTATKEKSKAGSFKIDLKGAIMGKVVTRFPPEPSGYLHIGHAKALLLNDYFATAYKGKMLMRFDDTNPSKETGEFASSILEDIKTLNVKHGKASHTSDHFDILEEYAVKMIKKGLAYVDSLSANETKIQRRAMEESPHRNISVKENLSRWKELLLASDVALGISTPENKAKAEDDRPTYGLRAKIDMKSPNGTMRDPCLYRCNLIPHIRTGTKYRAYPTYDFCCPIVDSIEGVTHTLRTTEYHDRDVQYYWIIDALELRKPVIWDYSRLNFVYTLLSKRKLKWFVDNGHVSGWDDPRFPTVRGMIRRGLTVQALREFILAQGASKTVNLMTWDKIWTVNKKIIDPKAPRYTAIRKKNKCPLEIIDDFKPYTKDVRLHPKNAEVGKKSVLCGKQIFIEQDDALAILNGKYKGKEVTLMGWGNIVIKDINSVEGVVTKITAALHLEGSVKKTKLKLTWLGDQEKDLIPIKMVEFDHLITVQKLEDGQNFEDYMTPKTLFDTYGVGEAALRSVKKGDIIQIQRRGFFIADQVSNDSGHLVLFQIPSGKANTMSALSSAKTDYKKQQK